VNFWEHSKRYCSPKSACSFLEASRGRILRVGVFVNADPALPRRLYAEGLIDIIQLHGDESPAYCHEFTQVKIPFIRAIGVKNKDSLQGVENYHASAILLDTHAPGLYGGTGDAFDWNHACAFIEEHPDIPVMLAGGITTVNVVDAISTVSPCAIDIASGAELSPGIKDFKKIETLLAACSPSE